MKKESVEEVTKRAIENGGILARLYFDMQSEKPDDLQPLMAEMVNNKILKTPGVIYCYGSIDEPIKVDEATYSTSAVLTILFKDFAALINVAFNYAPAGVEILKPEKEYVLRTSEMQSIVLDVAQISVNYSQYILSKVLSKEDFEKIKESLERREKLGRELLDKAKKKEDPNPA
ncbi:MAG: hypothetical protein ACP5P2_00800 [Candidatus Micrarchaeia archaeon]|jgi:hypothetical protein